MGSTEEASRGTLGSMDSGSLAPSNGGSRAPYAKLHPGPGWPREQAASHQRARIHAAMIELVAERGYGAVKVRELVGLAGVSARTFYEHFADKDECFLRTYGLIVRRSTKEVGAAQKDCHDWREQLRLAFCAWADGIAREPRAARLALVEAFAGWARGARADAPRGGALRGDDRDRASPARPTPCRCRRWSIKGIVAGLHRVARAQLLAGREHELPGLADELLEWMLCFRCRAATSLAQLDAPPAPAALAPPTPGAAPPFTLTIATCAARSACASSKRSRGSRPRKATVSCGSRGSAPPRASRASASTSTSRTSRAASSRRSNASPSARSPAPPRPAPPPAPGPAACTARCARYVRTSRPIRCWRGWGSSRCSRRARTGCSAASA